MRTKFLADPGIVFIRPGPAMAFTQNRISEFYSLFPFHLLANCEVVLWLIHWDNRHWLLYIADIRVSKSYLLDPASNFLPDGMECLWYKLDLLLVHLLQPQGVKSFEKSRLDGLPLQSKDGDCGLFVCQYALDYCKKKEFHSPNLGLLRNEINKIVRQIIASRTEDVARPPETSTHPVLLNALSNLRETDSDVSIVLAESVRAASLLFPERFKKKLKLPSAVFLDGEKSAFSLRMEYESHPKSVIRRILPSTNPSSLPTREDIEKHFSYLPPPPLSDDFNVDLPFLEDTFTDKPITADEIDTAFKTSSSSSSPGSDGLLYSDWTAIDPHRNFLTEVFNYILKTKNIPIQWQSFKTSLLLKPLKEDFSHLVSSWRPIAIMDTVYRIFATVMNSRLLAWVVAGNLISREQKALLFSDGCAEHNAILLSVKERFCLDKTSSHICWLDLTEAFPSVPYDLIWYTLKGMGCAPSTITLIKEMYYDVSTVYNCCGVVTNKVKLFRGVKQGCPLSMTLFCLSIDFLLKSCRDIPNLLSISGLGLSVLAYADDLVVIGSSAENLKIMLDRIGTLAGHVHLKFNGPKCGYYCVDPDAPATVMDINGEVIPTIEGENTYKYLGVPFGAPKRQNIEVILNKIVFDFEIIAKSDLHPSQKLDAFCTFLHSRLPFHLRNRVIDSMSLTSPRRRQGAERDPDFGFDDRVRKTVKQICEAQFFRGFNNEFIYTSKSLGGLGIMPAAVDYYIQSIVGAYRFFVSNDLPFRAFIVEQLALVAKKRFANFMLNDISKALEWLSDTASVDMHGPGTWWTKVRNACRMLRKDGIDCIFFMNETGVCLKVIVKENSTYIFDSTINNKSRLCSVLHDAVGLHHFMKWSSMTSQGIIAKCLTQSIRSHMVLRGYTLSSNIWLFAIKARNNNLPLMYRSFRLKKGMNTMCRRCNTFVETAAHVLNHCPANMYQATRKHNSVLDLAGDLLRKMGHDVDLDKCPSGINTSLRPDIVIRDYKAKQTYILDIKVSYDDPKNFDRNRTDNNTKYQPLADEVAAHLRHNVYLNVINVGCLGSWDPINDEALKRVGLSNKEISRFATALTACALKQSYYIFLSHVTGQKYNANVHIAHTA